MQTSYRAPKVGILGGGQLGQMLIQAGIGFAIDFAVMDPNSQAPCQGICDEFVVGDFSDPDAVYQFGKDCDLVTIEIEAVSVEGLRRLVADGVKVFPQVEVIELMQDKGKQKQFLQDHDFPTADFGLYENKQQILDQVQSYPKVQKLRIGGFDGRGVQILADQEAVKQAFDQPSLVEDLVDIKAELGVVVARNEDGDIRSYDPVMMHFEQEANILDYQFVPAKINDQLQAQAKKLAHDIAEQAEIVGTLAIELFVTSQDELLVNEMAPRVHNSGHHTIDACVISQFEQHLRAIMGLPLGNTDLLSPAVMINLLGEQDYEGEAIYKGLGSVLQSDGVRVHLYGKMKTRPYRKMGHLTVVGSELSKLLTTAESIKNNLKIIA